MERKNEILTPPTFEYDCDEVVTDEELSELIDAVNRKPLCDLPQKHENKMILTSVYYLQAIVLALLKEGYRISLVRGKTEDETVITWGDEKF